MMRKLLLFSFFLTLLFQKKMIAHENETGDISVQICLDEKRRDKLVKKGVIKEFDKIEGVRVLASLDDYQLSEEAAIDILSSSANYEPFNSEFCAEFTFKNISKGAIVYFLLDIKKGKDVLIDRITQNKEASFMKIDNNLYIRYIIKNNPNQKIKFSILVPDKGSNQVPVPDSKTSSEPPLSNPGVTPNPRDNESVLTNIQKSVSSIEQRLSELEKPYSINNNSLEFNKPIYHSSIFFEKNSFALNEKSSKELFKVKNSLPSQFIIVVKTYTDKDGDWDSNLVLSTMRANKISDFFINNGVNPLNIRIFPLGELNVSNSTSKDSDRRGEITIYAPSN